MRDPIEKLSAIVEEEEGSARDLLRNLWGRQDERDKHGNMLYPGVLGEPIDKEEYMVKSMFDGLLKKYDHIAIQNKVDEKLDALFGFYQISPHTIVGENPINPYIKLIIALAKEHIPGFKYKEDKPKPGRPNSWDADDIKRLFKDVAEYKQRNPKHSIASTCANLMKSGSKYGGIENPESLKSTYLRFKRKLKKDGKSIEDI